MTEVAGLCFICGKVAVQTCSLCGRAFCEKHIHSNVCDSCRGGKARKGPAARFR